MHRTILSSFINKWLCRGHMFIFSPEFVPFRSLLRGISYSKKKYEIYEIFFLNIVFFLILVQSRGSCALHHPSIMNCCPRLEVFILQSQTMDAVCMPLVKVSENRSARHEVAQRITPTPTSDRDWNHLERLAASLLTPIYSSLIIWRCKGPKLFLRLGKVVWQVRLKGLARYAY